MELDGDDDCKIIRMQFMPPICMLKMWVGSKYLLNNVHIQYHLSIKSDQHILQCISPWLRFLFFFKSWSTPTILLNFPCCLLDVLLFYFSHFDLNLHWTESKVWYKIKVMIYIHKTMPTERKPLPPCSASAAVPGPRCVFLSSFAWCQMMSSL